MTTTDLITALEALPAKVEARAGATADPRLVTARAESSALDASLERIGREVAGEQAAVDEMKASALKRPTLEESAIDMIADCGIDPLPAVDTGNGKSESALRAKLARETDPMKRADLCRELRDLSTN